MMPVRQFQLIGLVHGALMLWTGLYVYTPRNYTGGLSTVLADLTDGGFGDRFYAAVVAVLVWGHVPLVYLLAVWGVVLAVGSILPGRGAPHDPGRIPTVQLFWWSLAIAAMIRSISGTTAGPHRFLDSPYYGASFGALWVWVALALAAVVVAVVRRVRGIPSPDVADLQHTRAARVMTAQRRRGNR